MFSDDSSSGSSSSSSDSSEESDEDDVGMEALVSGDQETLKPAGADAPSSEKQVCKIWNASRKFVERS